MQRNHRAAASTGTAREGLGRNKAFSAVGTYTDGSTCDITASVTKSNSSEGPTGAPRARGAEPFAVAAVAIGRVRRTAGRGPSPADATLLRLAYSRYHVFKA